MNGFGLLIAVAALGVDVGWEPGPGGQNYYTIHIEKLLLQPLREGQAIVSKVDAADRNLTRFQILVGEHAHAISSQPGLNGADLVQHGWRPGENGGTDYLIQISPERLESLAKGSTIIGQIDAKVTDIRKLYVFSGVQELPKQLANSNGPPLPPKFLGTGGGLRTASGETTQPNNGATRVGAPQFNDAQFNAGQSQGSGRANDYPANSYTTGQGQTGGAPQFDDRQYQQDVWRTNNQANGVAPNGNTAGQFRSDSRMLPVTQQGGQQQPAGQNGYGPSQNYAPPLPPSYGAPNPTYTAQGAGYPASNPTYAVGAPANNPNLDALVATQAKALGAMEAKAAAAEAKLATAEAAVEAANALAKKATEASEAAEPRVPLIMTTLMLFTSLAINVFLGWMAWSFFWRFRDAAGDATRAQSTLFPTRQAA